MWLLGLFILCIPFSHASTLILISNETFLDHPAAFGPRISPNGKLGFLIEPVADPMGCSIVEAPCTDWIALVKRGECSFITKIRTMQESGAIAVIVGDPERSEQVTMYSSGDTSDILIPSVFLARDEYKRVLHLTQLLESPLMAVLQLDEIHLNWPFADILFIIMISPCIMLTFVYAFWKIRENVRRRKELAPASAVSRLSIKIFSEKEHDEEGCAICLEEYQKGTELRLLPCNHQFHTSCVDAWLTTQKKLCPICKRDITMNV